MASQNKYVPKRLDESVKFPTSSVVDATLTDFYQISMAYAYYKSNKMAEKAIFDCFFRKCPFNGEYCIVAGVEEVIRFVNSFGFSPEQVDYLRTQLPDAEDAFFDFLLNVDTSEVKIRSMREGDVAFPREPVMVIEGPLVVCQLLETTILNLMNYPSLVATCAARHRRAADDELLKRLLADSNSREPTPRPSPRATPRGSIIGGRQERATLLEFGCRRAQGPDGALSGSRYSYLGGFDGSSNVKAGHLFDIPIGGTHAHAFVVSFSGLEELSENPVNSIGSVDDFTERVLRYRKDLDKKGTTKDGELVAFIRYAQAFPKNFLVLVDTYDTLLSGLVNFMAVALALDDAGFLPKGIRLDSGDLAYLSRKVREYFYNIAGRKEYCDRAFLQKLKIAASNDINERILNSLNEQGHSVDIFGIGTNLITCQQQPALGMVYKLVELDNRPRIKISEEMEKVSIPSKKQIYRLYGKDQTAILDMMQADTEPAPVAGDKIFCRHIMEDTKRCYVVPTRVEGLLTLIWDGKLCAPLPDLHESREFSQNRVGSIREDHLRPMNPTPYKVSVSNSFFDFFRQIWQQSAPVREFS